jgi:hypothetical protein
MFVLLATIALCSNERNTKNEMKKGKKFNSYVKERLRKYKADEEGNTPDLVNQEGCNEAFSTLADAIGNGYTGPGEPINEPSQGSGEGPVEESSEEPAEGGGGVVEARKNFDEKKEIFDKNKKKFTDTVDPILDFAEKCQATIAKKECYEFLTELTEGSLSDEEKAKFNTVCAVGNTNQGENKGDGARITFKISSFLFIVSLIITNFYFNN